MYYRRRFGLRFQSRAIAEYPYDQFVEKDDPPFYFRLKKGYRSRRVNINMEGMRSPELRTGDGIKRIMFLGESVLFGVKLFHEKDLWSTHLKRLLDEKTSSDWEVLNFSFPGYNSYQYKAFFENELSRLRPEILVMSIGGNDISQAMMFGEKWFPGMTYPYEFIMALSRKSGLLNKALSWSCLYFLWRRKEKGNERQAFITTQPVFNQEECLRAPIENITSIVAQAQKLGIKTFYLPTVPVFSTEMSAEEEQKILSIQSNWRQHTELLGPLLNDFFSRLKSDLAVQLNMPVIDLRPRFWNHPERFLLFFDMLHLKPKGMRLLAEYVFEEMEQQGCWATNDKHEKG